MSAFRRKTRAVFVWLGLQAPVTTTSGDDQSTKRRISKRVVIIAGASILLIGLSATAVVASMRVEVPALSGLSPTDASIVVAEAGLLMSEEDISWVQDLQEEFQVVAYQYPFPGDIAWRGDSLTLRFETGKTVVPRVIGLTLGDAERALVEAGLRSRAEFDDLSGSASWRVTAQNLAAGGGVDALTTITLELDVPDVEVPEVVGIARIDAEQKLEGRGFTVKWSQPDSQADWEVMAQDAAAGTAIRFGSTLVLELLPPKVSIPDIVAMSQTDARAALEGLGLTVVFAPTGSESSWSIAAQSPIGGTSVREGDTVTIALKEPTIIFEITGNGTRALITWAVPGGSFSIGQENNARLPWSMSFPYRSSYSSFEFGNISAQMLNGSSITCTITVNGRVTKQITSTGSFAIAMCG